MLLLSGDIDADDRRGVIVAGEAPWLFFGAQVQEKRDCYFFDDHSFDCLRAVFFYVEDAKWPPKG